jgi:AraC family transcriptional activator of tynA and feaB
MHSLERGVGCDHRAHPGEAALASIDRLSTAGLPASERLAYWKGIFDRSGQSLAIDAEPGSFQGVLTRLTDGELEITSVKSTPLRSRNATGGGSDERRFSLHLVHAGRCLLKHAGVEIVAETGDMIVVDARKPYDLTFTQPVHGLVLSVPWARFGDRAEVLERLAGRPVNLRRGPSAVLSGFIRSAWEQLVEPGRAEWPHSASEVIWDLLASMLQDDRCSDSAGNQVAALRCKATRLVDHRLFDPEFRTAGIAQELGISARYLQRVFAEAGTTPARFLLARRLDAAATRLRQVDKPCRITDIAMECGFSDLSYFSRAFRLRFGISARAYRQEQSAASIR